MSTTTTTAATRAQNMQHADGWVAWGLRTGRLNASTAPGWREKILATGATATAQLQALPIVRAAAPTASMSPVSEEPTAYPLGMLTSTERGHLLNHLEAAEKADGLLRRGGRQ